MAAAIIAGPDTFADVLHLLGDIPPERILARPAPGTATEDDLIEAHDAADKRLCELVDGVLVLKTLDFWDSALTASIAGEFHTVVEAGNLGFVTGPDGPYRLLPGHVRVPDVAFVSWDRIDADELPDVPIAPWAPDLAVEVLNPRNSLGEMTRKLDDYFKAGVQLVWIINRATQIVDVHTSPKRHKRLTLHDTLDGGRVLPGFRLPLKELFASRRRRKKSP